MNSKKAKIENRETKVGGNGLPDIGKSIKDRYISAFQEGDRDQHCSDVGMHLEALFAGLIARIVPAILMFIPPSDQIGLWSRVPFVFYEKTSNCLQDDLNFVTSSNLDVLWFCGSSSQVSKRNPSS